MTSWIGESSPTSPGVEVEAKTPRVEENFGECVGRVSHIFCSSRRAKARERRGLEKQLKYGVSEMPFPHKEKEFEDDEFLCPLPEEEGEGCESKRRKVEESEEEKRKRREVEDAELETESKSRKWIRVTTRVFLADA